MTEQAGDNNSVVDHSVDMDFDYSPCDDQDGYFKILYSWWRDHYGFVGKSVPGQDISLYYDVLVVNSSLNNSALMWMVDDVEESLTYSDLISLSESQAGGWFTLGVRSGTTIAIVTNKASKRIIALFAALRLGLIISFIVPVGRARVSETLLKLDCDYIFSDYEIRDWIPTPLLPTMLVSPGNEVLPDILPFSYPCNHVVFRLLDSYGCTDLTVVDIPAQLLFLNLIRDGFHILKLSRGKTVCATGDMCGALSPFIELATLFCGSTLFLSGAERSKSVITRLLQTELYLVEITPDLRDSISKITEGSVSVRWSGWFRSILDSSDLKSWKDFDDKFGRNRIEHMDLLYLATSGGIALGNPRHFNVLDTKIYSSKGSSWQLGDISNPENISTMVYGRYCSVHYSSDKPNFYPSPVLLSPFAQGYRYLGCYPTGRMGKFYPSDNVCECLAHDGSWHVIIERPGSKGPEIVAEFILLAFMETRSADELRSLVACNFGHDALPDAIEIIPLMPRFDEKGKINKSWCSQMYFSGEFNRRARSNIYKMISELRYRLIPRY
jgi:hypothetical protein